MSPAARHDEAAARWTGAARRAGPRSGDAGGTDPATSDALLLELGECLWLSGNDEEEGLPPQQAADTLGSVSDKQAAGAALLLLSQIAIAAKLVVTGPHRPPEGLSLLTEAYRTADALGLHYEASQAGVIRGTALETLGRRDDAAAIAEAVAPHGTQPMAIVAPALSAVRWLAHRSPTGSGKLARVRLDALRRFDRQVGSPETRASLREAVGVLRLADGRSDDAADLRTS